MGKLTDYEVVEEIGTGTFGTCCKIRRVSDGQLLVWKQISYSKMNEAEKESLVREVNLLRELSFNKHAHIVRYIDRIVNKAEMTLFLGEFLLMTSSRVQSGLVFFFSKQKNSKTKAQELIKKSSDRVLCRW